MGKGKKVKTTDSSLGAQLMKDKKPNQKYMKGEGLGGRGFVVHTTDIAEDAIVKRPQLTSILEQNSLEEFMQFANLSKKQFESVKAGQVYVEPTKNVVTMQMDSQASTEIFINNFLEGTPEAQFKSVARGGQYRALRIPRRPIWTKSMTGKEITQNENVAFLEWRRDIARQEEGNINLAITPFEKNVEVWRQLWRVIEKSDLLLQVVDARNPYFFYSSDLEKYIRETSKSKEFILLINKADYLTPELVEHWNAYFKEIGVKHIFFSALFEQKKIDDEEEEEDQNSESSSASDDSDDTSSDESDEEDEEKKEGAIEETKKDGTHLLKRLKAEEALHDAENDNLFTKEFHKQDAREALQNAKKRAEEDEIAEIQQKLMDGELTFNTTHTFNRRELLALLKTYQQQQKKERDDLLDLLGEKSEKGSDDEENEKKKDERLMVGMVGYPNVGKSSVINVLCGKKLVGVANRPGKTKHFQTLNLSEEICLCDCPGLVFPSFANSTAEMMTCGVLPIDSIKNYVPPIQLIMSRISKEVLEEIYKVKLPEITSEKYSAEIFLLCVASRHGWISGRGIPHEAAAVRHILKQYTSGKLLYCQVRPDFDEEKHGPLPKQCGFNAKDAVKKASAQNYQILADIDEGDEIPGLEGALDNDYDSDGGITEELKAQNATGISSQMNDTAGIPSSSMGQDINYDLASNVLASNIPTDDFDAFYFGQRDKVKLNKQEKRALKFATKKGHQVTNQADLKGFLATQIEATKSQGSRGQASGATRIKKGVMKVGDYQQLESNYDM